VGQSFLCGVEPQERRGVVPGAARCCALWGASDAADPPMCGAERPRWGGVPNSDGDVSSGLIVRYQAAPIVGTYCCAVFWADISLRMASAKQCAALVQEWPGSQERTEVMLVQERATSYRASISSVCGLRSVCVCVFGLVYFVALYLLRFEFIYQKI
jgi:hypothetical protein